MLLILSLFSLKKEKTQELREWYSRVVAIIHRNVSEHPHNIAHLILLQIYKEWPLLSLAYLFIQ